MICGMLVAVFQAMFNPSPVEALLQQIDASKHVN